MKKQYAFKAGERGKFYRPGAVLQFPVYLDETVQSYFTGKASETPTIS